MSSLLIIATIMMCMSCFAGQQQQQQCSVDNLPEFGDTPDRDSPDRDSIQAIVPAYTFQCTGRVTEWRACVLPGGMARVQYYIQFQVWRPAANGIEGCYELVDYNIPLDDAQQEEMNVSDSTSIIEAEGYLVPVDRCVVLPVRESQQIEFQPDDVVGYYVDHFRDGDDDDDGGIQWISSTAVTVYYIENIARVDIKTQYALSGPDPTACGFQVSDETSNPYSLSLSAVSAPIISLSFSESMHSQSTNALADLYLFACAATVMLTSTVAQMLISTSPPPEPAVTSSTLTILSSPPMTTQPSVPPPAIPPSGSQDDNTAIIVGSTSVLAIAIVAIGKLFYSHC